MAFYDLTLHPFVVPQCVWGCSGCGRLRLALGPPVGPVRRVGEGTGRAECHDCNLWPCDESAHPALQHPLWKVCQHKWRRILEGCLHSCSLWDTNPHTNAQICENLLIFLLTVISCDLFFPPSYIDAAEFITQSLIGKLSNTRNSALQNSDLQNITILFLSSAFTVHKKMSVVLETLKADVNDCVSVPAD